MENSSELSHLIVLAKSNKKEISSHATMAIIEMFHKMIYKIISENHLRATPDLMQSGYIGIIEAIKTYNSKKASFSTWAYYNIRNAVQKEILNSYPIRVSRYLKGRGAEVKYELSEFHMEESYEDDPKTLMILKEDTELLLDTLVCLNFAKLSKIECDVFYAYFFEQKTEKELNEKYRIKNTKQILNKIRRYLRSYYAENIELNLVLN